MPAECVAPRGLPRGSSRFGFSRHVLHNNYRGHEAGEARGKQLEAESRLSPRTPSERANRGFRREFACGATGRNPSQRVATRPTTFVVSRSPVRIRPSAPADPGILRATSRSAPLGGAHGSAAVSSRPATPRASGRARAPGVSLTPPSVPERGSPKLLTSPLRSAAVDTPSTRTRDSACVPWSRARRRVVEAQRQRS